LVSTKVCRLCGEFKLIIGLAGGADGDGKSLPSGAARAK